MDDSLLDISDDELLVRETQVRDLPASSKILFNCLGIIRHNSVFALLAVIVNIGVS